MDVEILGPPGPRHDEILTPKAMDFLATLHELFDDRRLELLEQRRARQNNFDSGERPDFLPESNPARSGNWRVASPAPDLMDRRVEITGPVERKMMINALNSGARVFMADFEDSASPTWPNMVGTKRWSRGLPPAVRLHANPCMRAVIGSAPQERGVPIAQQSNDTGRTGARRRVANLDR